LPEVEGAEKSLGSLAGCGVDTDAKPLVLKRWHFVEIIDVSEPFPFIAE